MANNYRYLSINKSPFQKYVLCLSHSLGACGTSIFLVLVGYVKCNHVLAVTFISLSIGFIGFQGSGSLISHLDIASNYAGELLESIVSN